MPTASVLPPGPILSASVTLSSAQVLASFTTPVTVIPAPGAGLTIVPSWVVYNYTFGGTAYTDHAGTLRLALGTVSPLNSITTAGFWDQTTSQVNSTVATNIGQHGLGVANVALTVSQSTANPTGGNGTVTVTVAYMVVPVS